MIRAESTYFILHTSSEFVQIDLKILLYKKGSLGSNSNILWLSSSCHPWEEEEEEGPRHLSKMGMLLSSAQEKAHLLNTALFSIYLHLYKCTLVSYHWSHKLKHFQGSLLDTQPFGLINQQGSKHTQSVALSSTVTSRHVSKLLKLLSGPYQKILLCSWVEKDLTLQPEFFGSLLLTIHP